MPSNDYIINQMRAEALAFYGMGESGEPVERVAIEVLVAGLTASTVECLVVGHEPDQIGRPKICEFLRSEVTVQYFTAERAVVLIPKAYLPAFALWRHELKPARLADLAARVAVHNAPLLRSGSSRKPEKIGNIRI